MGIRLFILLLFLAAPAFAEETRRALDKKSITDVYVVGFIADEKDSSCDASSVAPTHRDARIFFTERAQQVTHKILHDYFYWSPCYMTGELRYKGKLCSWEIYASGIGGFSCAKGQEWYFACDDGCEDLLIKVEKPPASCKCDCNPQGAK